MKNRITIIQNADYPHGYPWPVSARLEVHDGDEWVIVDYADGDTADEARAELR